MYFVVGIVKLYVNEEVEVRAYPGYRLINSAYWIVFGCY